MTWGVKGTVLLAVSVLGASGWPDVALSDSGSVSLQNFRSGILTVLNDGSTYTVLLEKPLMMTVQLKIALDAASGGGIKNWQAWLHLGGQGGPVTHFSPYRDDLRYTLPYPKTVQTVALLSIPHKALEPVVVAHCRALASRLKAQGKTHGEIYNQDRVLNFGLGGSVNYELGNGGNRSLSKAGFLKKQKRLKVICKAAPKGMPIPG